MEGNHRHFLFLVRQQGRFGLAGAYVSLEQVCHSETDVSTSVQDGVCLGLCPILCVIEEEGLLVLEDHGGASYVPARARIHIFHLKDDSAWRPMC